MIVRLGIFLGCCLAVWLSLFVPAWFLWPDYRELSLVCSLTAGVLCILPTTVSLVWSLWGLKQNPQQQLVAVLGSTGIRMFFVLGFGLLLAKTVPVFLEHQRMFWFWILVFYLVTLGLEVTIVVIGQQKQIALSAKNQESLTSGASQN